MPEETTDLSETIAEVAQQPKKVSGDGQSVEEHSIDDLIKADKHNKANRASSRGIGARYVKFVSPGTA